MRILRCQDAYVGGCFPSQSVRQSVRPAVPTSAFGKGQCLNRMQATWHPHVHVLFLCATMRHV